MSPAPSTTWLRMLKILWNWWELNPRPLKLTKKPFDYTDQDKFGRMIEKDLCTQFSNNLNKKNRKKTGFTKQKLIFC